MKDGIAVTRFGITRIFERRGTTWAPMPLSPDLENNLQGPDIEIDGGRILISRNRVLQSAVLRKINGTWDVEGTLPGHGSSCSYAGNGNQQDIHGTHAVVHNHPGPTAPESGDYLSAERERRGLAAHDAPRENGRISNAWIALNWPNWAISDQPSRHRRWLRPQRRRRRLVALRPAAGGFFLDSYQLNSVSTNGIERFRDLFAQRNWSYDRNTYVVNLFRINDDAVRSSEQVATLQPSDGAFLGNQIDSSGNRIIVSGWSTHSGNDTVRVFEVPENLEAPAVQVHDFELASAGAAWQPAAGSTFRVVRVANSGMYRQGNSRARRPRR